MWKALKHPLGTTLNKHHSLPLRNYPNSIPRVPPHFTHVFLRELSLKTVARMEIGNHNPLGLKLDR